MFCDPILSFFFAIFNDFENKDTKNLRNIGRSSPNGLTQQERKVDRGKLFPTRTMSSSQVFLPIKMRCIAFFALKDWQNPLFST